MFSFAIQGPSPRGGTLLDGETLSSISLAAKRAHPIRILIRNIE